jgi:hypothetical protein
MASTIIHLLAKCEEENGQIIIIQGIGIAIIRPLLSVILIK